MEVKFANCYVPVWKIRKGTLVLADLRDFGNTLCFISGIYNDLPGKYWFRVENGFGIDTEIQSDTITWLEPH